MVGTARSVCLKWQAKFRDREHGIPVSLEKNQSSCEAFVEEEKQGGEILLPSQNVEGITRVNSLKRGSRKKEREFPTGD